MSENWQPVLDPWGKIADDLDPEKLIDFKRGVDGPVQRFKLGAVSPYFNVAGLYWRKAPDA